LHLLFFSWQWQIDGVLKFKNFTSISKWLWASENLHGVLARTKNVVRVGHLQRCVSSLEQKAHVRLQPVLTRGSQQHFGTNFFVAIA